MLSHVALVQELPLVSKKYNCHSCEQETDYAVIKCLRCVHTSVVFNLSPAFWVFPEKLSCHHLITQLIMVKCHLFRAHKELQGF